MIKEIVVRLLQDYCSENCIGCNLCSSSCPHGVIRPFLLDEKEVMDAPDSMRDKLINANIKDKDYKFSIGVSLEDCTGCSLWRGSMSW